MAHNKVCNIDVNFLPIKLHYFFFYGAMGGVISFMPVVAKGLGISATALGLINTIVPFCVFLSKPIFGYLTDYFHNIKLMVFTLVSVTSVAYFSVLFIPKLENLTWADVQLECVLDKWWLSVISDDYDEMCLHSLKEASNCELNYTLCDTNSSVTFLGKTTFGVTTNGSASLFSNQYGPISPIVFRFEPYTNFACDCVVKNSSLFRCASPGANSCFTTVSQSVYKSYQFWAYTFLALMSGAGCATVFCLSDAACFEVLGDHPELYGRQRLWATIGWGCATLLAGLLNDVATGSSNTKNYSPCFYLMLSFVTVDLILLLKIKIKKANFSINICKEVRKIFSTGETVVFAVAVFIYGNLTGLVVNYQFWYLQDLGANQTLLGMTVAVRCLAGEVPLFYFTGWFIKKFGHSHCLTGSLAALSLVLGLYGILKNPWIVLPIETLHGGTFAMFYASMSGYASENAPPGTEATMLGIFGGLFEGLGFATGSLLGGVGFDSMGGRTTFLIAGAISFISTLSFALAHSVLKKLFPKS